MEDVIATVLIAVGVRVFAVALVNTSSDYTVKGCFVMVHGFTAHPGTCRRRMSKE
jgi:hypothetical protein